MVKRVGYLMPRIASPENLREAFLRAAKGKSMKNDVIRFREHLKENLRKIEQGLLTCNYDFNSYHFFKIYDPKQRVICAASFPDRIVFHAVIRICHPVFDRFQIFDSYACRVGKGTYRALDRALHYCRRYEWFAKLDVCKYFDSIDHDVLMNQLCKLFKDPQLLILLKKIVGSYSVKDFRGLPIGNLTSQYFANHYLSVADHYAKEQMHVKAMVRYMDDILLFSSNKEKLMENVRDLSYFLKEQLKLELHEPIINRTFYGIPFLGYVVKKDCLRLHQRSRKRFVKKMMLLTRSLEDGTIDENDYVNHATCLMAFINKADVDDFKYSLSNKKGIYPYELEPRETWRQLEQQREELPCLEPQQQHSFEPQQQQRLPLGSIALSK